MLSFSSTSPTYLSIHFRSRSIFIRESAFVCVFTHTIFLLLYMCKCVRAKVYLSVCLSEFYLYFSSQTSGKKTQQNTLAHLRDKNHNENPFFWVLIQERICVPLNFKRISIPTILILLWHTLFLNTKLLVFKLQFFLFFFRGPYGIWYSQRKITITTTRKNKLMENVERESGREKPTTVQMMHESMSTNTQNIYFKISGIHVSAFVRSTSMCMCKMGEKTL